MHTQAVLLKADALFMAGNFEFSLLLYHKGKSLRPDIPEFAAGISKAKIAMDYIFGKNAGM